MRQLDDAEAFLLAQRNRLVFLDEVQRLPELFAVLRGVIDIRRRSGLGAGQFLLLGSALADLMLVRRLPAWNGNAGKRLIRAPKVYVRDSGIVHAPLGLESLESVLGHPVACGSWEGFVIEQLIAATAGQAEASFYRTSHGAEADLVLTFRDGKSWVIEVKRSSAPTVSKGFHLAAADLAATRKLVVAPVGAPFPMREGVETMGPLTAVAQLASLVEP